MKPDDRPTAPLTVMESGPPEPVVYFAYGSNMSTARLRERTPSCRPLGMATLLGHVLRFHKSSKDKSGKCNAFATGDESAVTGVLFNFDPAERSELDKAEGNGKGYNACIITVVDSEECSQKALTYLAAAEAINDNLKPYTWYRAHVRAGAAEHGLPADYVARYIEAIEADEDPDKARDQIEWAKIEESKK